ncbi:hypothetical protein WA158_004789 [Blastocystis sp. Blastoise]
MQDGSVVKRYGNTEFDASQQAKQFFTAEETHQYRKKYREVEQQKFDTERNLKNGVFKNYPTFIKFSEEMHKIDNTLEELQTSLDQSESFLVSLKSISLNVTEEKRQKKYRVGIVPDELLWLKDVNDDLEIYLYQRRYVEAVELALKAKSAYSSISHPEGEMEELIQTVSLKINELISVLIGDLKSPILSRADRRRLVRLLVSLDEREVAQQLFLDRTSDEIQSQSRQVNASGDIIFLIKQLSDIFFEILHDSGLSWQELFSSTQPSDDSIFVVWMLKEIDSFVATILLYALGKNTETQKVTYEDFHMLCSFISPILTKSIQMDEIGYSIFPYLLKKVGHYISSYTSIYVQSITDAILSEPVKTLNRGNCVYKTATYTEQKPVSNFATVIYESMYPITKDLINILTADTLIYICPYMNAMATQVCSYITKIYQEKRDENTKGNYLPLLSDLLFLSEEGLPQFINVFNGKFENYQPDFDNAFKECIENMKELIESIYKEIIEYLVDEYWELDITKYLTIQTTPSAPSKEIMNFLEKGISALKIPRLKSSVYETIFTLFDTSDEWKEYDSRELSVSGYYALCLDIALLLQGGQFSNGNTHAYSIIHKGENYSNSDAPKDKWIKKILKEASISCNINLIEIKPSAQV